MNRGLSAAFADYRTLHLLVHDADLGRVTYLIVDRAKADGLPIESFTVHDLRRTGSTILNELGFNSD